VCVCVCVCVVDRSVCVLFVSRLPVCVSGGDSVLFVLRLLVCVSVCLSVCLSACVSVCTLFTASVRVFECACPLFNTFSGVCVYVYVYVYVYVCVCVCSCMCREGRSPSNPALRVSKTTTWLQASSSSCSDPSLGPTPLLSSWPKLGATHQRVVPTLFPWL
jgi:hypothetical protein